MFCLPRGDTPGLERKQADSPLKEQSSLGEGSVYSRSAVYSSSIFLRDLFSARKYEYILSPECISFANYNFHRFTFFEIVLEVFLAD